VRRYDDLRLQTRNDLVRLLEAENMFRPIDGKRQHIDPAPGIPDLFGRICPVIAPDERSYSRRLDQIGHHVEMARIVGRIWVGAELLDDFDPLVPSRLICRMLIGDATDLCIGERKFSNHAVQNAGGIDLVDRVVVEMGVGR
jgi:hypothetical protein